MTSLNLEKEITINNFNGDTTVEGYVEVRGTITSDSSMDFNELSKYNSEFNLDQFEEMVSFSEGICKACMA